MTTSIKQSSEEVLQNRTPIVADGLRALIRMQELVEQVGSPSTLQFTGDNLRTCMLAIEEELHELGREMNWRPWHKERVIDVDNMLKECGDWLAFTSLMLYYVTLMGVTPDEIAQAYCDVSINNLKALLTKRGLEE